MSAARAHDPPPAAVPPDDIPVATLLWPDEAATRDVLARAGRPRLLWVADGDVPPVVWAAEEDWLRVGAGPTERGARLARLAAARPRERRSRLPVLDLDGVLHHRGSVVVVPPIEAALLTLLLDRVDHVVRRTDLRRAGWPSEDRDTRALDGRIRSLRRRLLGTGVTIHTVRGVGYLLEVDG